MADQKLISYVKYSIEDGKTKEQIWAELRQIGWPEESLKGAFHELGLLDMAYLPGFGDLLGRAFQFYKNRFWTLIGIMLPSFISGWMAVIMISLLAIAMLAVSLKSVNDLIFLLFLILLGLILFIALLIVGFLSQAALLMAIKDKDAGFKKSFTGAWHKITSYYLLSILSTILTFGSLLLFFIPGIILATYFNLALYIFIAEGKTGMSALLRSKQLVEGKWWTVFIRQLAVSLMTMAAGAIIALLPLGQIFAGLAITPFVQIFGFLLYQDLKKFKKDPYFEPPKTAAKIKLILMAAAGYLLPLSIGTIWFFRPIF